MGQYLDKTPEDELLEELLDEELLELELELLEELRPELELDELLELELLEELEDELLDELEDDTSPPPQPLNINVPSTQKSLHSVFAKLPMDFISIVIFKPLVAMEKNHSGA